ncbi:helix-turn-helix domain-containing protein [Latilactobacillus curvatus]|uniref:helix-turn-helix domain-containing protein n=1 Tax=Latilactobacillus curvatus TaxID=28038 RepID=UPI0028B44AB0|nr:helix-turn-helix transcriptional regulator [Latilactobacillus curvatus]MDT7016326.1 helix-turn-helix transcriptional regulator [Latilactobacillus curvatus]
MTLFERIKFLTKKQGKNLKSVALDLGFGENYLYTWKRQTPSAENLQKVADYFHVSTDYLLGRTDNMNIAGNDDQYNHDLKEFIESNMDGMAYGGEDLTAEDKQKLEMALKLVFDKYNDKF